MRRAFAGAWILSLALAASSLSAQELSIRPSAPGGAGTPTDDARPSFADGELLVRWNGGAAPGAAFVQTMESAYGLARISFNPWLGVHRYRLAEGVAVADALRGLRNRPGVEYVEPNWIWYLEGVPNDGFYDNYAGVATDLQKWYFDGIGADRNLNAEAAWDITTGRSDVVIAIVDSGIDLDHPDLAANIWSNPGEIPNNNQDDDGNGFVDDVNGWDFYWNDNDPNPDLGDGLDNDHYGGADSNTFHGTFSASCAGAVGNNGTGLAGAAWNCKLMSAKIFTDDGGAYTSDIADGITYAANNGADVINMSFGGGFSSTVQSATNDAWGQGCVQVASAGNGNSSSAQYPASYAHVISVGAGDSGSVYGGGSGDIDGRASFSQYGTAAVDVVAPGALVVGAGVNSVANGSPGTPNYQLSSGTSFSGPLVAGLAALVISRARDLSATITNDDVESIIQNTANDMPDDPNDAPNGGANWDNHGRVDFTAAVNAVQGGGGNQAPVANAGADQAGNVGQSLSFNGSGSSDPDNDPLTYSWNFGDGSPTANGMIVNHAYASANVYTVTLTVSDGQLNDADTATATISAVGGQPRVLFSSLGSQSYSGLASMQNEDVVAYEPSSGGFTQYFDGSDVGLSSATIDGFTVLPDGDLLFSLTASFSIAGLQGAPSGTTADDSDIVRFTPSSLGPNTAGIWSFYFDASDVGLTSNGEDVDCVGTDAGGNLILSVTSSASATGISGVQDEDLIRFTATSLGAATAGSFSWYFDGSDVGLSTSSSEDVDAFHLDSSGRLYLSTLGNFAVTGASGADEDVLRFTPTALGASTSGSFDLYLDGSAVGIPGGADINALHIED
ncbi:MAG: S8 family serine peptidase [Planctomycetota bacterium]|nr:S8 family serine peptidase [Planctomycetota bacterium]